MAFNHIVRNADKAEGFHSEIAVYATKQPHTDSSYLAADELYNFLMSPINDKIPIDPEYVKAVKGKGRYVYRVSLLKCAST